MVRLGETRHVDPLPTAGPGDASDPGYGRDLPIAARCRARLDTLLGPMPARVPLRLETLESVECDGYRRDKVVFDTEAMMSVPAYLLVPHGRVAPGPAVLAAHGHGPGKAEACGLERTGTAQCRLRAPTRTPRLCRACSRHALLRRAPRLEPR